MQSQVAAEQLVDLGFRGWTIGCQDQCPALPACAIALVGTTKIDDVLEEAMGFARQHETREKVSHLRPTAMSPTLSSSLAFTQPLKH
ncbi:MAG: hypothetical protein ACR2PG_26805 [Hyphomicrobiaceae bacterium]